MVMEDEVMGKRHATHASFLRDMRSALVRVDAIPRCVVAHTVHYP